MHIWRGANGSVRIIQGRRRQATRGEMDGVGQAVGGDGAQKSQRKDEKKPEIPNDVEMSEAPKEEHMKSNKSGELITLSDENTVQSDVNNEKFTKLCALVKDLKIGQTRVNAFVEGAEKTNEELKSDLLIQQSATNRLAGNVLLMGNKLQPQIDLAQKKINELSEEVRKMKAEFERLRNGEEPLLKRKRGEVIKCIVCLVDGHRADICPTFPTAASREAELIRRHICIYCLRQAHGKCSFKTRKCTKCTGRHTNFLCPTQYPEKEEATTPSTSPLGQFPQLTLLESSLKTVDKREMQ